nr:hypothetical protein [Tanacetum cinerariifolium]
RRQGRGGGGGRGRGVVGTVRVVRLGSGVGEGGRVGGGRVGGGASWGAVAESGGGGGSGVMGMVGSGAGVGTGGRAVRPGSRMDQRHAKNGWADCGTAQKGK